jgi:hypothetical protein
MAESALPGDVVKWFNTAVCKTAIHRFESGRRLHRFLRRAVVRTAAIRPVAEGCVRA